MASCGLRQRISSFALKRAPSGTNDIVTPGAFSTIRAKDATPSGSLAADLGREPGNRSQTRPSGIVGYGPGRDAARSFTAQGSVLTAIAIKSRRRGRKEIWRSGVLPTTRHRELTHWPC